MKVLKFGGTSVGTSEAFEKVRDISLKSAEKEQIVVVVSAISQMTNLLQKIADKASCGDDSYYSDLSILEQAHINIIRNLISIDKQSGVIAGFKTNLNRLEDILKGIFLVEELTEKSCALVLSFGEVFSSKILYNYFLAKNSSTVYWDSLDIIVANGKFINAHLEEEKTKQNLLKINANKYSIAVMPGFIARNEKKQLTTLGRGGSDYTASIVAANLKADVIEIWTDVNGILTADPSIVKQATTLESISFDEAMELSHFGAKVIYPLSIQPAFRGNIPILIKNTFNPSHKGTQITSKASKSSSITGLSAIKNIAIIDVLGAGMISTPGYASRVFKSIYSIDVNIILITQASSEHSITIAIKDTDSEKTLHALNKEFEVELKRMEIRPITTKNNLAIIALIGENMKSRSGISGKAFSIIGSNGINIRAIAQGSSEKNISMVISQNDLKKTMNVLHEEFFLSDYKKIHIFLAGVGNVGSSLISQIISQKQHLRESHNLEMVVVGIINSTKYIINEKGIDLNNWEKEFDKDSKPSDISKFRQEITELNLRNSVFVDNTANENVAKSYEDFLRSKISVACSNKIAISASLEKYNILKQLARDNKVSFLHEATVGAGLPIIDTINNLVSSGDKITKMEGVLSGSLSFIFDNYNGTKSFGEIVAVAKKEGYTEPDPRIDLSGKDVARKILILARESGYALEEESVDCETFLPISCLKSMNVNDFIPSLEKEEAHFRKLYIKANKKREILKIVATFDDEKASVGLKSLNSSHPFYNLKGTDNMLLIYTERYPNNPMIIQGAGAGAAVTAAGVFGDIMRTFNR